MAQSEEIWKDIVGWEGLYQVSNLGRIKSLSRVVKVVGHNHSEARISEKILKSVIRKLGYEMVTICKVNIHKHKQVHRVVAEVFIPNPDNKPNINHIDCNPLNNKVENLEWCTQKENREHAKKMGRVPWGQSHFKAKITQDDAIAIKNSAERTSILANQYGISMSSIGDIRKGRTWLNLQSA